jgi:hypothetical protein
MKPLHDNKTNCLHEIAGHLVELQKILDSWSLAKCTNLTFIARDPDNDNMIVVVTNEKGSIKAACEAALRPEIGPKEGSNGSTKSLPEPGLPGTSSEEPEKPL